MQGRGLALWLTLGVTVASNNVAAFILSGEPVFQRTSVDLQLSSHEKDGTTSNLRRSLVQGAAASLAASLSFPVFADTGGAEVRGTPLSPFNSLSFQYRGSDYGGLKASDLNEPSVSYKEFVDRLKAGEVEFVEFMAPNGDAAYVKFKGGQGSIRIGEGYPIEQPDGWSSPAFAVRTVKDAGVPYKFTVPALRAFKN
jgi:hypothetical protein